MKYKIEFANDLTRLLDKMDAVLSASDTGTDNVVFKELKKELNALIKDNSDSKPTIYELFTKNDVNFKCNEL